MSKTIYEEALESYGHINAIVSNRRTHLTWEEEVHHLANIARALQKAEKQEKLLNKIKEIIDRPHTYIASMLESSNRYYEIEKLIKESQNNGKK